MYAPFERVKFLSWLQSLTHEEVEVASRLCEADLSGRRAENMKKYAQADNTVGLVQAPLTPYGEKLRS